MAAKEKQKAPPKRGSDAGALEGIIPVLAKGGSKEGNGENAGEKFDPFGMPPSNSGTLGEDPMGGFSLEQDKADEMGAGKKRRQRRKKK